MSRKAFDKIAEGLREAVAIARGEATPAKLYVPAEIDVRGIRSKLGISQEDFSAAFGFTVHQIRQWEQGRARPTGAARAYLMIIDENPDAVREMLRAATTKALKAA
ncbi:NadS family protein [Xanthobacter aminoxidans]|uniref:NadS family protein n=1 Tax=Xanthobacter aminoxidans TaxID=186280 RepID=A0ABW6ZA43_9HYPH